MSNALASKNLEKNDRYSVSTHAVPPVKKLRFVNSVFASLLKYAFHGSSGRSAGCLRGSGLGVPKAKMIATVWFFATAPRMSNATACRSGQIPVSRWSRSVRPTKKHPINSFKCVASAKTDEQLV